jgi:2'-5' RNA ligase
MNNASDELIRTFLAFDLPDEAVAALRQAQRCLIDHDLRISWVKPENIHLTVKFLGEVSPAALERVSRAAAASAAAASPMKLTVKGLGVFPDARRPRVVWAGLSGATQSLIDFQNDLEENLATAGFAKEPRPFKAHLTLGRVKKAVPSGRLVSALEACLRFTPGQFSADRLILFRSDLKPEGAVYTVLKEFPLSGSGPDI